jgi:hypothetical protein
MLEMMDITSRALTPKEALRAQLLSRSAMRITAGQLRAQFFDHYSVGQITSALLWDLQLRNKPLKVRLQLCADFLREHPTDPVSPAALRWHFGLTDAQVISALHLRERSALEGFRLNPVYPGADWQHPRPGHYSELGLEGAYWHPLEVLHLHVIARRRLRPEEILDRRIFPGVALRDIRHHLESVRIPSPEVYRRCGGQLAPWARRLILEYLDYCRHARQFVLLSAVRELFGFSANAMSHLSAEAGWTKTTYYEFRRQAYRELVSRYILHLEGAGEARPSDVLVCKHASRVWRFPAEMIRLNLTPALDVTTIRRLSSLPLPLAPLSGKGSEFEWFRKIPGRKLLYDVFADHFGVIPRWELCDVFLLTENSFRDILALERIDPQKWDRAWLQKKSGLVFCLPDLSPQDSLDCVHAQILADEGIDAAEASRLELLEVPARTLQEYRKKRSLLRRSQLSAEERESRQLDPLTYSALRNYLRRFSAEAAQDGVMKYFGVDRTCLNKVRQGLALEDGPACTHWGRTRLVQLARRFDSLELLLGLVAADAVRMLHIAVTRCATGAGPDAVVKALFPDADPVRRREIAESYRRFSEDLAACGHRELTALIRAYLRGHPGVPLRRVAETTGLTERRIEGLLPGLHSGRRFRRAEWSRKFAPSGDSDVWAALRASRNGSPNHRNPG